MARLVLVTGASGSGKSTSLQRLNPQTTIILSPNRKMPPFAGAGYMYPTADDPRVASGEVAANRFVLQDVTQIRDCFFAIAQNYTHVTDVVVEDLTHYMNRRTMSASFMNDSGFGKWNKFGADFYEALVSVAEELPQHMTIYVIGHVETKDNGDINLQTSGKLLDNTINLPSYFTYALYTTVIPKGMEFEHVFMTRTNGAVKVAKTPVGLFSRMYIPNDLAAVRDRILAYEQLPPEVATNVEALNAWAAEQDTKDFGALA